MATTGPSSHAIGHRESAGHLAVHALPTAHVTETADAVWEALRGRRFDSLEAVYVVDELGRLEGVVPMTELAAARPGTPLSELVIRDAPRSLPGTDQEEVALLAQRHGIAAIPVVDIDGALLGAVSAEVLIDVLRREHMEDITRLAGVLDGASRARTALAEPLLRRLSHRLPWLIVGLLGSMVAAAVVSRFEATLEATLAVAFFVPGIVYLADAVGTQTEAIAVRGLAHERQPLRRLLPGEVLAGLMIGLVLSAIALPAIVLAYGSLRLGLAVAISVTVAGGIATTIGLLFPWLLSRFGADPAFGSGPVATIVQDVFSLLTYFVTVSLLL